MPSGEDLLWRRVLAALIDAAWLFWVGAWIAYLAWGAPAGFEEHRISFGPLAAAFGLSLVYFFVAELAHGRTLGKLAMGVRVVRDDGEPPNWRQVLARTMMRLVDMVAAGVVGLTTLVLTRPRRRLGDMVARTQVVRAPRAGLAGGVLVLVVVACAFRVAWAATPFWPSGARAQVVAAHSGEATGTPFVYLQEGTPEAVAARSVVRRYVGARTARDGATACAQLTSGARHDVYEKITRRHVGLVDARTCADLIVRDHPQSHLAGPDMRLFAGAHLDVFRWSPVALRVTGRGHSDRAFLDLLLIDGRWRIETQSASLLSFMTTCGLSGSTCGCIFQELRFRSDYTGWQQYGPEIAAAQSGRPTRRWRAARAACTGRPRTSTRRA